MKKNQITVIALLLTLLLVLAACAPKEEVPAEKPQEEAMPAEEVEVVHDDDEAMEEADTDESHEMDDDKEAEDAMEGESMEAEDHDDDMDGDLDMEALIEAKVAGNHDLGRIFNADKTREEWEETIDRMIGYGAEISAEEKEIIIEYLLNQ